MGGFGHVEEAVWVGKLVLCMFSDMGELSVTCLCLVGASVYVSLRHVKWIGRTCQTVLGICDLEGGIKASSLYSTSSHEIGEHDNEQALDGLQDRVNLLKRVSLLLLATCPRFLVISFILTIDAP
ncbi:hypothetical protein VNO80_14265 [Phaseolus coccineus]|uniref:Uncharacterized protein n=1 Tax=Phaseolus coccineus TaxID=3886 RepID=A0AAN9MHL1_PHACN